MKYLVGIPCLYGAEHTRDAIESVVHKPDTHVLLIDNGADDAVKALLALYEEMGDRVTVIHNQDNIYVNPAWNQIMQFFLAGQYDYLLIMNSDLILNKGWNCLLDLYFAHDPNLIPVPSIEIDRRKYDRDIQLIISHTEVSAGTPGVLIILNRVHAKIVYPIPGYIKIWFGDNWVYEILRALNYKTVIPENLISFHSGSQNVSRLSGITDLIYEDQANWKERSEADKEKVINASKEWANS